MPQALSPKRIFIFTLAAALLMRVWLIFQPALEWWDASIYIGIGKFVYTHGRIGVFEVLRPYLWPLIQGGFWRLGLDPNFCGKILEIIFSAGVFCLVYLIGESMKKYAGAFAALILAAMPVFFSFAAIPITDIPSVFWSLLAVWFALNKRWFWSGLMVSIAFTFRFPHALTFAPIICFLFVEACETKAWREFMKRAGLLILGTSVLIVPFLIYSKIFYGDALLPIKTASSVASIPNEQDTGDYFFYAKELLRQNWFIIFGYLVLIATPFWKRLKFHRATILLSFCLVIVGAYFSQNHHREVRYAIAFLPYAVLLAGYAIAYSAEKKPSGTPTRAALVILIAYFAASSFALVKIYSGTSDSFADFSRFEHFFDDKTGVHVVTNYPMIVGLSDVKLDEIYENWENGLSAYGRYENKTDYFVNNSCQTSCATSEASCQNAKESLMGALRAKEEAVFDVIAKNSNCELAIFKIRKD